MMRVFASWMALGAATGVVQAVALWQVAHRWREVPLTPMARVPIVAAALIAAAFGGMILPTAAGWACGLAGTSVLFCVQAVR